MVYYLDGQYEKNEEVLMDDSKVPKLFKTTLSGYNIPEKHKHRKRTLKNLSGEKMEGIIIKMREIIQEQRYLEKMPWAEFKINIMNLLNIMENYCAKLRSQRVRNIDARESPRTALETRTNVQIINKTSGNVNRNLTKLNAALLQKDVYDPISIREHLETSDRRRVYDIIEVLLQHGLNKKCVHYIHNLGGNKQTLHFLWEIPQESPESELINLN